MHSYYMHQAIIEAWKYQFLTYPNPSVGACVVYNNKIISVEAHKEAGKPHAEVLALQAAYLTKYPDSILKEMIDSKNIHDFLINNHNDFFKDKEIYVTLEPCNHIGKTPSCANLLKQINIKKVYIGMLDLNKIASGGIETLIKGKINVEVISNEECKHLLLPFNIWQKDKFRFFKMAMREDGTIDGGYITTQKSLNYVHEIRAKLELLIIGGNTVRIDRPTLDSRFSKSKIPSDVLVYSRKKDFDKSIPLFNIENREVIISDNIEIIKSNFTMIEGGYKLLNELKNSIDMLMLFISHREKIQNIFDINQLNFKIIHSFYLNEFDEIIFLRRIYEKD